MDLENKKILFIDLDGTLIEVVKGKENSPFPEDVTDFRIRKQVLDQIISKLPHLSHIEIVTNQAGVPLYYSHEEMTAKLTAIRTFIFHYINKEKPAGTVMISVAYQVCFSIDKDDPMRKPNTGMLDFFSDHRGESKEEMLMIGDASGIKTEVRHDFSDSDKMCAQNFGIDYLDIDDFLSL